MKKSSERDALYVLRSTSRKIIKIHREFRAVVKKREQLRLLELVDLADVVTAFNSELRATVDAVRSSIWDGQTRGEAKSNGELPPGAES